LSEAGYDLALTGFDDAEIERLLADIEEEPVAEDEAAVSGESSDADEDDITPPTVAVTRPGDLWLLGEHRLICADSRDAAAVVLTAWSHTYQPKRRQPWLRIHSIQPSQYGCHSLSRWTRPRLTSIWPSSRMAV
jgi:hypothetical protein